MIKTNLRLSIVFASLLIPSICSAQSCLELVPDPPKPRFSIEGSFSDIAEFANTLRKIESNSPAFREFLDEVGCFVSLKNETTFDQVFPIRLDRKENHFPANYRAELVVIDGNRSDQQKLSTLQYDSRIDVYRFVLRLGMNNIDKLPRWIQSSGNWKVSNGVTWATTREAVFAHEIAEFFHGLRNGKFDYAVDHQFAVEIENAVRADFGQSCARGEDVQDVESRVIHIGPHREGWVRKGMTLVAIEYRPSDSKC